MRKLLSILTIAIAFQSPSFALSVFDDGIADTAFKGNTAEALKQWTPIAEQGDAKAQFMLGELHNNRDEYHDSKMAFRWYTKAAEQGYAEAQDRLANFYSTIYSELGIQDSDGINNSDKIATEWYLKAAEQGNMHAQFRLGRAYEEGRGAQKDLSQAAKWYRKAAEQGDEHTQWMLAVMYAHGNGVPQDYKQAAEWFRKSAEQGRVEAQSGLAGLYEEGKGVPRDYVLAYMMYSVAGSFSKNWLEALTKKMTPGQIREAQKLVSNWHEGVPLPTKSRTGANNRKSVAN